MILLRNGTVYDGLGGAPQNASVLVEGETIQAVGNVQPTVDAEMVDCSGLAVAPGFVDVHSHSDLELLEHRSEKILQGITSEVVGNCGFSLFPKISGTDLVPSFAIFKRRGERVWEDTNAYFGDMEISGSRTNAAVLTGHGTLRGSILGMEEVKASSEALARMKATLSRCLEQGSVGLSTGLNEVPGSYADFDELLELCKVVKNFGGLYTSHLRDYKFHLVEAIKEAIDLGRRSGVRVELSHLQAVGRKNWDKLDTVLELVEAARKEGVDVGMDAYPYVAGSAHLTQMLPVWSLAGGTLSLLVRLRDAETRERIARETEANMSNGWDDILVASVEKAEWAEMVGKTIGEIAREQNCPGIDAALNLLLENQGRVRVISFNQSDENLRKVLTHPLTCIITDGLWTEGRAHPRAFGTYPTLLGEYVREKKWMSLEEAIHKATELPASRFHLQRRGALRPGNFADIAVFDAKKVSTRSSYMEPSQPPEGVVHVMVNGQWAVRNIQLQSAFAGVPLKMHSGA